MSCIRKNQKALFMVAAGLSVTLAGIVLAQDPGPDLYPVGQDPKAVVMADFNNDNLLDVAVANSGSNNLSIFLGNANGGFDCVTGPIAMNRVPSDGEVPNLPACVSIIGLFQSYEQDLATQPSAIAVGDFNNDRKLDLAVANKGTNNVSIYLGNGDGTFQAAVNYAAGPGPSAVAVGDFNNDGKLDLAVADSGANYVSILLGVGDGTFGTATTVTVGNGPSAIAVGDFNNDNIPDLAVANSGDNTVSILISQGSPAFSRPATTIAVGTSPSSIAVGRFHADRILDLAVANSGSNNVSILLGDGMGHFTLSSTVALGMGTRPVSIVTVSFNPNGYIDLVTANNGTNNASLLSGNGTGGFTASLLSPLFCRPTAVAAGYSPYGRPLAITGSAPQACPIMDQLGLENSGGNGDLYIYPHCYPPCHK